MMKNYAVRVNTVGYCTQVVYVKATSAEDAETQVFEQELWDDGAWKYQGITADMPELDYVEEVE